MQITRALLLCVFCSCSTRCTLYATCMLRFVYVLMKASGDAFLPKTSILNLFSHIWWTIGDGKSNCIAVPVSLRQAWKMSVKWIASNRNKTKRSGNRMHNSRVLWASYQICKIAGSARAGNAGNVYPAADFTGNRLLAIPACITARASRTDRDACRDR